MDEAVGKGREGILPASGNCGLILRVPNLVLSTTPPVLPLSAPKHGWGAVRGVLGDGASVSPPEIRSSAKAAGSRGR